MGGSAWRFAKVGILLMSLYALFYFPVSILGALGIGYTSPRRMTAYILAFAILWVYLYSIVNTLVCIFRLKPIRKAVRKLLFKQRVNGNAGNSVRTKSTSAALVEMGIRTTAMVPVAAASVSARMSELQRTDKVSNE